MHEFKTNYDLYEYFMSCIGNRRVYLVRFSSILLLNFKKKRSNEILYMHICSMRETTRKWISDRDKYKTLLSIWNWSTPAYRIFQHYLFCTTLTCILYFLSRKSECLTFNSKESFLNNMTRNNVSYITSLEIGFLK